MRGLLAAAIVLLAVAGCTTPYGSLSGSCFKSTNYVKREGTTPETTTISAENCISPAPSR